MNKKLIFRILGALASALIIVSVFVPFVSVTGYTTSLWESFELTNSLYLPIMIIVFGVIGVIFFALNIKTEFAYMSTGAITFFIVMQTIDILNQGVLNTLSIGYYLLVAGTLLTGLMAFLCNLKSKDREKNVELVEPTSEPSMLGQIDKLYSDEVSMQSEISPIQPVNSMPEIQPVPVQPIQNYEPIQSIEKVQPIQQVNSVPEVQPIPVVTPVEPQINPEIVQVNPVSVEPQQINPQPVNPVVQEFAQPVNPVVQQFSTPTSNPVVQEFSTPQVNQQPQKPVIQEQPMSTPVISNVPTSNPVVQEFTNSGVQNTQQSTSNGLDIFGQ